MDYKKIYDDLCESRQKMSREKLAVGTLESHHIFPKSIYGKEFNDCRVMLTKREHALAHFLLFKHYLNAYGPDSEPTIKMAYALAMMLPRIGFNLGRKSIKNFNFKDIKRIQTYPEGYKVPFKLVDCPQCGAAVDGEINRYHGKHCAIYGGIDYENYEISTVDISSLKDWEEMLRERSPTSTSILLSKDGKSVNIIEEKERKDRVPVLFNLAKPNSEKYRSSVIISNIGEDGIHIKTRVAREECDLESTGCPFCHSSEIGEEFIYADHYGSNPGFICDTCCRMLSRTVNGIEGLLDALEYIHLETYRRG